MAAQLLIVAGMHRSGTSLGMQALAALGAQSGGALLTGNDFNEKGYWEAAEIVAFHDRLLARMGRGWGRPEHMLPVGDLGGADSAEFHALRDEAAGLLAARLEGIADGRALALKDPRMTLFLPLWLAAAQRVGVTPRIILCLRHPAEVAASLERRDGTAQAEAEALWLNYTLHGLRAGADADLGILPMSGWAQDAAGQQAKLAAFTGLSGGGAMRGSAPVADPDPATTAPFDPKLAHAQPAPILSDEAVRWWHALAALAPLSTPPAALIARAADQLAYAAALSPLPQAIRAEIGDTPSAALERDMVAFRDRAREYQDAYRAAETRMEALDSAYKAASETAEARQKAMAALEAERDRLKTRAEELLAAYQAESQRAGEYHAAYQTEAQRAAELHAACDRLQTAYDTEAQRAAELRARLDRLDPRKWLKRR